MRLFDTLNDDDDHRLIGLVVSCPRRILSSSYLVLVISCPWATFDLIGIGLGRLSLYLSLSEGLHTGQASSLNHLTIPSTLSSHRGSILPSYFVCNIYIYIYIVIVLVLRRLRASHVRAVPLEPTKARAPSQSWWKTYCEGGGNKKNPPS